MSRAHLAVIGNGRWAQNYPQAAREAGNAQVVQMISSRPEREEELIDDVDALVYAGHPASALYWAGRARKWDLPILIEKPAALNIEDAAQLVQAEAPLAGNFVLIGHQHLFAEGYEHLRELAHGHACKASARFTGPVVRDYPARYDYGAHAAACLIGLAGPPDLSVPSIMNPGVDMSFSSPLLDGVRQMRCVGLARCSHDRRAIVEAEIDGVVLRYDGYAPAEPPLTREVRAFATAVLEGGTDDWRFGARWAWVVARILSAAF